MDYNRRIIEYLLVAVAIGLGVPVFALLGARDGERQAAIAYPRAEPSAAAAVARDYRLTVLPSADAVEQGRALFQRNCAACHGPTADGQGAAAGALKPPPRNFLDPKARWTRSRQPLNIYATVSEGVVWYWRRPTHAPISSCSSSRKRGSC